MTRDPFPTKYMLGFEFADGSAFVGETLEPKRFIRAVMREWQSTEQPVVRVISSFQDYLDDGRGYDIHGKYVARYRAMTAGKLLRSRGVNADGSPKTYDGSVLDFRPEVIAAAGAMPWGHGKLLLIDGVTSMPPDPAVPKKDRAMGWAILAGGTSLLVGAAILMRHKASESDR